MTVKSFEPRKRVLSQQDLDDLHHHPDFCDLTQFILDLNSSSHDVTTTEAEGAGIAPIVKTLIELFDELEDLVQKFDPAATKSVDCSPVDSDTSAGRFGNPLFRKWHESMTKAVEERVYNIINVYYSVAAAAALVADEYSLEASRYLKECFGDVQRIDYGTGHELNIICFLYCLKRLRLFSADDAPINRQLALVVFNRYLKLMRKLQFTYWLEPAGSHGVWGLDDYHFLPFMFGSSQLINHKYIRPKSIHDKEIVDEFSRDYLYLACIKFVNKVKTASLAWHSPMLNDISGVKSWRKVNEGMIKMYRCEVLGKLPIMQHFFIGRLIGGDRSAVDDTDSPIALSNCEYRPASEENAMASLSGATTKINASPVVIDKSKTAGEATNEVIVKYVSGPQGNLIPIYGRHVHGHHQAVETYALGQEPPKCCGVRIPSAVATMGGTGGRRIPFD